MPTTLVTREERKVENWRTLKILIGVMVLLITISVVTIIVKHHRYGARNDSIRHESAPVRGASSPRPDL